MHLVLNSIAVINSLLWSVSNTLGSLGTGNSLFKSAFANISGCILNANGSILSLFQRNSDITSINNSVVNLSLNFWNLSTAAWSLTLLPAALTTYYWIDNERLTQNINKLTSSFTVAYNSWAAVLSSNDTLNSVSLMSLSTTLWVQKVNYQGFLIA